MNTTITFRNQSENKQIIVEHSYQSPLKSVWEAYTKTEMLEKWWAPKPYKAVVITNDFEEGGKLFYYMLSPEGQKHYCLDEYLEIDSLKSYKVRDAFCDEKAVIDTSLPIMEWYNIFTAQNGTTTITNILSFENEGDLERILEMGFEEGYKMALNQLYELMGEE